MGRGPSLLPLFTCALRPLGGCGEQEWKFLSPTAFPAPGMCQAGGGAELFVYCQRRVLWSSRCQLGTCLVESGATDSGESQGGDKKTASHAETPYPIRGGSCLPAAPLSCPCEGRATPRGYRVCRRVKGRHAAQYRNVESWVDSGGN